MANRQKKRAWLYTLTPTEVATHRSNFIRPRLWSRYLRKLDQQGIERSGDKATGS
jgi:hypothetical protein